MFTSILLRLTLFIALLGLALFELRIAVVAQTSFSGVTQSKAVRKYQQQPRFLVAYGRQAILEGGDLPFAEHWFQRALLANPLYIPAWLALSELRNDEGNSSNASAILEYVDGLMQDVSRWRWNKAMSAYQLDRHDILASDLAWLLQQEKVSGKTKQKAVKLAFSLWPEPEELLQKMSRENVGTLFQHAIRTKNQATAGYFWPLVDQAAPEAEQVLPYINLLISNKAITAAAHIWKKYYPTDTLLYNGNLLQPVVNSGFDWRIGKIDGVESEYQGKTDNSPGLHLHFTGNNNVNYSHARQYIALAPEHSYQLSGRMRSSGLTTDQKPYLEITGLYCSMQPAKTDMVEADQDWAPVSLAFTVPEQCQGVQLRIRRNSSNNLDNLISGDLWLTDFLLQEMTGKTTQINLSELGVISGPFPNSKL